MVRFGVGDQVQFNSDFSSTEQCIQVKKGETGIILDKLETDAFANLLIKLSNKERLLLSEDNNILQHYD